MKRQVSASAKCPYYKCEERHEIFCSGLKDRTSLHYAFAIPAEKREHMKKYCKDVRDYEQCPIYQALVKAGVKV